VWRLSIFYPI